MRLYLRMQCHCYKKKTILEHCAALRSVQKILKIRAQKQLCEGLYKLQFYKPCKSMSKEASVMQQQLKLPFVLS